MAEEASSLQLAIARGICQGAARILEVAHNGHLRLEEAAASLTELIWTLRPPAASQRTVATQVRQYVRVGDNSTQTVQPTETTAESPPPTQLY